MNLNEARALFRQHLPMLAERGITWLPGATPYGYVPDEARSNPNFALDALPALLTTPSGGVPSIFTTFVDPETIRVQFAPSRAAEIFEERKIGVWEQDTALFRMIEPTGETSSYGDHNDNGRTGINPTWPTRQQYRYQTIKEYGELEQLRAGTAGISYVAELDQAAALNMTKFANFAYFFGIAGIEAFGVLNDPGLSASLTPALKAWGGTTWYNGTSPAATPTEVYNDILAIVQQLFNQTFGLVTADTPMVLLMGPTVQGAINFTNAFGVTVKALLKENYPNLRVEVAPQYSVLTANNSQGNAAGNLVQVIAERVEGQQTLFLGFSEKSRSHPLITHMSSWRQKMSGGTYGAVVRYPLAVASMVGV